VTMSDEQQKGLTRLLERLGTALLGLKAAVERLEKRVEDGVDKMLAQGSMQLTEFALLKQSIEEARRDVEQAEKAVDELRHDLTPVRGVPLPPSRPDDRPESIEFGPAKFPIHALERFGRATPWLALGFIVGLAAVAAALWMSGARFQIDQQQQHQGAKP
jgi:hypothetical protein